MKKTITILMVLVALCSVAFASGAAEAQKTSSASSLVINAEEYKGAGYVDPIKDWAKYDALVAAIKAETNTAKRTQMMHEAEDILMSNWCVIPIYYYNDLYMEKPYVSGVYSNPFATKFFQKASLSNGSKTMRINLASEPDYLDPALNSSVDGACLAAASFSGLYTYNEKGVTAPALAEGYKVSADGLTYTVTLKKNLKWSDGSALTAKDFEYSWKRAVAPETAADYEYMFSGFAGYAEGNLAVKAIDDNTLEFKLIAPCAYIEDLMAFPTFFPVKQAAVESYKDWKTSPGGWCQEAGFVSNGPFVCTGWNHDVSMTYEKNPYYYDAANVKLDKLEFMLSADDNAIFAAYNAGNLDLIDTVPTDEVEKLISSKNPEFKVVDELGTYYVAFNAKSSLFAGKTPAQAACIREAFSILIDRDYIVENIGQTGQVIANSFIPLGMADGNGGVFKSDAKDGYFDAYAINNDPAGTTAKAVALLKAAGYKFGADGKLSAETPISLTYLTNQSSGHVMIAESIQQDLAAVGISLAIQVQDWNVFLEERKKGNFDFAREGWIADFNDPINMLEMWTTTSGNNDCQFGR
ncbi:MAG: peptide ABC transporter substrate-binding protein [Spirochaetales bacterium]|nr:peptide ABC transporter substrate-binding protein [Spirochaetales bacterium]MBO7348903.1 peptide ABC transporter substrate-binding protein [Spirochaetales bacterium]